MSLLLLLASFAFKEQDKERQGGAVSLAAAKKTSGDATLAR